MSTVNGYFQAIVCKELQKDYIHDFLTQPLQINAKLEPWTSIVTVTGKHSNGQPLGKIIREFNSALIQNSLNGLYNNLPWTNNINKWGILASLNNVNLPGYKELSPANYNPHPNWLPVVLYGNQQLKYRLHNITRQNLIQNENLSQTVQNNGNGLEGPYNVTINSPSANTINFKLYCLEYSEEYSQPTYFFYGPNTTENPTTGDRQQPSWSKDFIVNTYQKAVAVTKDGSNNVLQDWTNINKGAGEDFIFNKTDNRGDETGSTFSITKLDTGTGLWFQPTTYGVDWVFSDGIILPLTSDVISIKFLIPGTYYVTNQAIGQNSSKTGVSSNIDSRTCVCAVDAVSNDYVTAPLLIAQVSATNNFSNLVTVNSALYVEGYEKLQFTVDCLLDISQASWERVVNGVSTMRSLSVSQWKQEMEAIMSPKLSIIKNGVLLQELPGLGPHVLDEWDGDYVLTYSINV